jgi:hypothetical protein
VDFDVIGKKIADANRKHKGSNWIAYQTEYGEHDTVSFSSLVDNYAGVEKSADAFGKALMEAYGPTFMKVFQDANNCMVSSRSELHRRRTDLSWNVPGDMSEIDKMVGQSRWLRVLTVRVRPGHTVSYEEVLKALKAGFEKAPNRVPGLVSQSAAGTPSGIYYVTAFGKSLGDFDPAPNTPSLREVLGERGYDTYIRSNRDDVIGSEWDISRILPELSSPTEGIAKADPAFWNPSATAPPKPAPKPGVKPKPTPKTF